LRSSAPQWVKESGRTASVTFGRLTASRRLLPSFLVIGGQRCGTTALHRALIAHPVVAGPVLHKGINYFDLGYHHGPRWYRGHFPLRATAGRRAAGARLPRRDGSSGTPEPQAMESSGYYLYHPLALPRIRQDLPDVRLIVMLRDPVERAYSAYKHGLARGFETEPTFEGALELEESRLAGEEERLRTDPRYVSHSHRHHAYLTRGRYAEQLHRLYDVFDPGQVHVVASEEFSTRPEPVFAGILEFLGLPAWRPASFERYNSRPGKPMPEPLRRRLEDHFAPYDEELGQMLGQPPVWRRPAVPVRTADPGEPAG
jgi:hypothetical protein